VLGPGFTQDRVPLTVALLQRVFEDDDFVVIAAKEAIAKPLTERHRGRRALRLRVYVLF